MFDHDSRLLDALTWVMGGAVLSDFFGASRVAAFFFVAIMALLVGDWAVTHYRGAD